MKMRGLAAVLAALFLLHALCVAVYASEQPADIPPPAPGTQQEIISIPEELAQGGVMLKVTDSGVEIQTAAEPEPEPLPPGAGSVIENTESGGKEFFTITTAGENVFYLVVDRERETDNVFFLKPVTEADLFGLAGTPERPAAEAPAPAPAEPVAEAAPAPKSGNGAGMLVMVLVIVIVGGGAGYYFKIYRPKQQQADIGEEYEAGAEYEADIPDDYNDYGPEPDYDSEAWYDGADEPGGNDNAEPSGGDADALDGGEAGEPEQPDKGGGT